MPAAPTPVHVPDDLPVLHYPSRAEWAAWLGEHHRTAAGAWLRIAKKGSGRESVTHPEALDDALCHGWIDGQRRACDESSFLQRFTPRTSRSIWSKINRARVEALITDGRVRPAGLAEVERARADGRWAAAYESQRTATVPADLDAALDASPGARAAFDRLDSRNRYAILFRLHGAKRPETRARRIAGFVEMLARGEKIYP
jgi:uncharacterized protein YdeI (YjbR/CyaY-like superfamily)